MTPNPGLATPRRPTALLVAVGSLALLAALALPAPVVAQDGARWSIHAYGLYFEPAGDEVTVERALPLGATERTTHVVDESGSGYGVEAELRWTRRLSVNAGAFFFDLDSTFQAEVGGASRSDTESLGVYTLYLGADWHLTPDARADLRLGAFVAQLNYEDVEFFTGTPGAETLRFDDDYGVGVRLGVDWPLRPDGPWSLRADLRYVAALLESEIAGEDVDLDPLIASLGVTFRW